MTTDIPLRCRCGTVRGHVTGLSATDRKRLICYCDDCQIYAYHLDRADLLDERGGTDILLTTPAQVTLEGALACVRLSPKGVCRLYAACCKTPVGNVIGPRVPVLIMPTACLDLAAVGMSHEQAIGAPVVRIHGRFAKGGLPEGVHPKLPVRMLPMVTGHLVKSWLGRRTQPSPFFDVHGQLRVTPHLIDRDEREALRARVLAAATA